jgi:hypothetical protein
MALGLSPTCMHAQRGHSANPLIEYYANDPVVKVLEIDIDALKDLRWKHCKVQYASMPICWPFALLCCVPCDVS